MKLVLMNDRIYPYAVNSPESAGGAEHQQWLLARTLAGSGWSITVGLRNVLAAGKRRMIDGVQFVGLDSCPVLSAWYRFLKSEQPHWWYWRTADHLWGAAVEIAKLAGVRTIFSAASDRDINPRNAVFRRPRWWPLYAWGLSRADRIFVQHLQQLMRLTPARRAKAYIVPNISDASVFSIRHSDRDPYVAWVGELRHVKRPDLLTAMARRLPEVRFVVCGGINDFTSPPGYGERVAEDMRRLPNMDYRGNVTPSAARDVIGRAAVLLCTSDYEGFPNTFIEAWSGGTPVVSLNVDPGGIIERKGLGMVSGDASAAVDDIRCLMASAGRRETIAQRALQYVKETHSREAFASMFAFAVQGKHSVK